MRLLIIAMLGKGVKADEIAKTEAALKEGGCDMDAVAHAHSVNAQRTQRSSARVQASAGTKEWSFDMLSSGSSKLFGEGGLIKRLLPTSSSGVVTQIVEALMDFKQTDLTKDYLYFDPKQVSGAANCACARVGKWTFPANTLWSTLFIAGSRGWIDKAGRAKVASTCGRMHGLHGGWG